MLIIPTHAHPHTLPFAIESACRQTISDVDIVVIGDGVDDRTRTEIDTFLRKDQRVFFLDREKTIRHGEEYRDEVIRNSEAKFIAYLGDDDLLFDDHLETMKEVIGDSDFANPLPVMINPDGTVDYLGTDLAIAESLSWHLDTKVYRNSVSLTGVMHTKESYLNLPFGWRPAPKGRWSDHYMWEQYFQLKDFSARTSHKATTAKFSQSTREHMTEEQRAEEVSNFFDKLHTPDFLKTWRSLTLKAVVERAVLAQIEVFSQQQMLEQTNQLIHQTNEKFKDLEAQLSIERNHLNSIQSSKSWKLTEPLRKLRSLL